jgi:hypothetical protein
MIECRALRGKKLWTYKTGATAKDVYNWWMEYDILPGQLSFEDLEREYEESDY